jgi:hypothetical protein
VGDGLTDKLVGLRHSGEILGCAVGQVNEPDSHCETDRRGKPREVQVDANRTLAPNHLPETLLRRIIRGTDTYACQVIISVRSQ